MKVNGTGWLSYLYIKDRESFTRRSPNLTVKHPSDLSCDEGEKRAINLRKVKCPKTRA